MDDPFRQKAATTFLRFDRPVADAAFGAAARNVLREFYNNRNKMLVKQLRKSPGRVCDEPSARRSARVLRQGGKGGQDDGRFDDSLTVGPD